MIKATYGLNVAATNDKYITAADEATQSLELLVAGSSMLEFFPLLAKLPTWLPGTGLLSRLKEARHANAKFRDLPWEDGKQQMVNQYSVSSLSEHGCNYLISGGNWRIYKYSSRSRSKY